MIGVDGVLSRIAELQARLGVRPPAPPIVTVTPDANGNAATSGADSFATQLAGFTGIGPASSRGPKVSGALSISGQDVVDAAKAYLGTPYVFGSTDPNKGLDCSALVQRAYADNGIKLPRLAYQQAAAGHEVSSLANARPGDILAFDQPVDHVGIYLGNNKMIAAPKPGDHVKVEPVYEKPTHIRRVLPDDAVLGPSAIRPASLLRATALSGVPYGDLFVKAGTKYGIAPKLLAAVAKVESGYDSRAVSPVGARGLMQLMPTTAQGLGVDDSFDPEQAIDGGARLLVANLREFRSVPLALAAYNAGGGAVRRYGGIPPFAETQAYVPKVQQALAALGG